MNPIRTGALAVLLAAGLLGTVAAQPQQSEQGDGSQDSSADAKAKKDSAGEVPALTAPEDAPRALNDERWRDRSHGISIRLPVDTRMRREVGDKYLFRLADTDGLFTMSLQVKRSRSELRLQRVAEAAREQLQKATATVEILDQHGAELGDRPGILLYADTPQANGPRVMFGQGIVRLDPQTYAVFEVRCDMEDRTKVRPIYEAMLSTLQITDPEELNKRRQETLQRGHEWREQLSLEEIHGALRDEHFYRLIRENADSGDSEDVGYMRVRQSTAQRNGEPGVRIRVQTRITRPEFHVDSEARYFLADDDSFEFWSVTTTRRPRAGNAKERDRQARTFVNTGIRADGVITITREGAGDQSERKYPVPETGYLSQVEAWLLPRLIPTDKPNTYGFYCYNAGTGQINYRTDKIIPTLNGFTIRSRLNPNERPIEAAYKADGTLIEKELSSGLKRVPADAQTIRRLWQNR